MYRAWAIRELRSKTLLIIIIKKGGGFHDTLKPIELRRKYNSLPFGPVLIKLAVVCIEGDLWRNGGKNGKGNISSWLAGPHAFCTVYMGALAPMCRVKPALAHYHSRATMLNYIDFYDIAQNLRNTQNMARLEPQRTCIMWYTIFIDHFPTYVYSCNGLLLRKYRIKGLPTSTCSIFPSTILFHIHFNPVQPILNLHNRLTTPHYELQNKHTRRARCRPCHLDRAMPRRSHGTVQVKGEGVREPCLAKLRTRGGSARATPRGQMGPPGD